MNRLLVPKVAVLLLFTVLIGRLYELQLVDSDATRLSATHVNTTRYVPLRPLRGEVYASDGKTLLAESVPIFTVALRPADLDQAMDQAGSQATHRQAEVFARLAQIIDITSTLTISPAVALQQNPAMLSALQAQFGATALGGARQENRSVALRLPVTPAQYADALTLSQRYAPAVRFVGMQAIASAPNTAVQEFDVTPATLQNNVADATLVISPVTTLRENIALHDDLQRVIGPTLDVASDQAQHSWLTLDVPPAHSTSALKLTETYSNVLALHNPIAEQVQHTNIPGYQTITIKRDIPRDVALALDENSADLPGVVVERDYRRRYPLSGQIQSLSHILGYIGRIDDCQLTEKNAARSWVTGLLDSIGHAVDCGILQKHIDPYQLGISRYQEDDRIGKDGVEASYEDQLRGQTGVERVVVDALGRPVRAPEVRQQAQDGESLVLTIDTKFQSQVEQIVRNWIAEGDRRRLAQTGVNAFKRDNYLPIRSGTAIVTDIHTGAILAMASWPSYDNNIVVDPTRAPELNAILNPPAAQLTETLRLAPLINHATSASYPPGSTLKQFDASIALEKGLITPETKVRDTGRLILESEFAPGVQYSFKNAVPVDHSWITVSDALEYSSNIFFMSVIGGNKDHVVNLKDDEKTIEHGLTIKDYADALTDWFGFGKPTGIELAGEQKGRVPTPAWKQSAMREAWTTGDTYNMAIGQGNMEATPLQLVMAASAIANNGTLYRPQIVKSIVDSNGNVVKNIQPEVIRQVPVDPKYFTVVREGMRRSVTEGANKAARDECSGLQIAGKTGTAEFGISIPVKNPDGTTRIEQQTHSLFTGFAPYDNPQIEVVVLSEGTGSLEDGSATIAVPAVTQIMQAYFNITPPNPLPRTCQQGMPALPPREPPVQVTPAVRDTWYGR